MPHAGFTDLPCPWSGCEFQIWFIDFQLELADQALYHQGVNAWQSGAGLIGCCPGCGRKVLYTMAGKFRVEENVQTAGAVELPGDWFNHALLLDQDGKVISF